jgi:predicted RNA binding protein YcfA (HicA-like mRNA interferase family)
MPKLPRISGTDAILAFGKAGFREVRTTGSHHILKKDGHKYLLSIPVHRGKTVGTGLLKSQIEATGLTLETFLELL